MPDGIGGPGEATASRSTVAALVVVFGVHAGVAGTFGPRVPAVKEQLGIDDGTLGLALTAMAVAMFAGTRVAGWATARVAPRSVIGPAVPLLCAGLLVAGRATILPVLVAAMVAMGLAMGTLDVAMNAEAVDIEARGGRPVLGLLHGSWSAGLLLAGGVAALVTARDWTLEAHLTTVAAVLVLAGLATTLALPGATASATSVPVSAGGDVMAPAGPVVAAADRYRSVAVLGMVAGASFAAEGAAIDWTAVYLRDGMGTSDAVAAAGFVTFSCGMALSRFAADRVVTRWGPVPVVRLGGLIAATAMALVVALPWPVVALAGLAAFGAALAPVVPVVFRAAGVGPDGHRHLAWVVTTAYLGSIIGPAVIGLGARLVDLRVALVVVVGLALVIAAYAPRAAAGAAVTR